MQNQMKNLITHLTSWSGLSGPIPNATEMRRKRDGARMASLGVNVLGHPNERRDLDRETKRGA
jgi:hypothetical protein